MSMSGEVMASILVPGPGARLEGIGHAAGQRARLVGVDWSAGYREYAPPRALAHALSCVWVSVTPDAGAPPTRVLPDACTDLIWRDGTGVSLAGPDTGPVLAASPPGSVLAGVRFRPGAGGAVLGLPLSAVLDQQLDPDDLRTGLPGGRGARLVTQVHGGLAPEEAVHRLVRLTGEMVTGAPPDPLAAAAAQQLGRPGSATARCCCAACCVSAASCPGSTLARPWTTWPGWPPRPVTPTRRT